MLDNWIDRLSFFIKEKLHPLFLKKRNSLHTNTKECICRVSIIAWLDPFGVFVSPLIVFPPENIQIQYLQVPYTTKYTEVPVCHQ